MALHFASTFLSADCETNIVCFFLELLLSIAMHFHDICCKDKIFIGPWSFRREGWKMSIKLYFSVNTPSPKRFFVYYWVRSWIWCLWVRALGLEWNIWSFLGIVFWVDLDMEMFYRDVFCFCFFCVCVCVCVVGFNSEFVWWVWGVFDLGLNNWIYLDFILLFVEELLTVRLLYLVSGLRSYDAQSKPQRLIFAYFMLMWVISRPLKYYFSV